MLTRPQSTRPRPRPQEYLQGQAKAKAKSKSPRPRPRPMYCYYYCIVHTSHHTTILNPISVCKLFLDIMKSLPPGRVTPMREPAFVFRHGDSAGLAIYWPWPCRSRPVNGKAKALSAKAKAKTTKAKAKAHSAKAKAKAAISSP